MRSRIRALTLLAALAAVVVTSSSTFAGPRAVIELFTSQGCSSCPAADKLLGELSKDPSIIALSLSIDYWDYLGWKDTLAIPGHAKRQRAYAAVRGDRRVYTPQAVINGEMHVVGSDKAAIERAINQTRKDSETLSVPVNLEVLDGRVTVSAAASPDTKGGTQSGEIWLCPLSKTVTVPIGRGENNGHTVTYHNVVRRWVRLGEWTGAAGIWSIPLKDIKGDDIQAVAVVVQAGRAPAPGAMLGAAVADLR